MVKKIGNLFPFKSQTLSEAIEEIKTLTRDQAEVAYAKGTDEQFEQKELKLGPWSSYSMIHDPKHLAFTLARYKFCAKMLEGKNSVIEVGPGDGIGLPIIAQAVDQVYAIDWDDRLVSGNIERLKDISNIQHMCLDINEDDIQLANVDAAITVDVIEHLDPEKEYEFMRRIVKCLSPDGILITGTPNLTASQYASPRSRAQHINLHDHETLREMTEEFCRNVFSFGMNDEILHCGYGPMCHYLFTVGCGIK